MSLVDGRQAPRPAPTGLAVDPHGVLPEQARERLSYPLHLPAAPAQDAVDPELAWAEQAHVIDELLRGDARSAQVALGPSEIGSACDRRIGYALARVAKGPNAALADRWMASTGTWVHAGLTDQLAEHNRVSRDAGVPQRWVLDQYVEATTPGGRRIFGHLDVYDLASGLVMDWKFPGQTTYTRVRKARAVEAQYVAQIGTYAVGVQQWLGLPVHGCVVVVLPRGGRLVDAVPVVIPLPAALAAATEAMTRYDRIYGAVEAAGAAMLPALPVPPEGADAHCGYCPWLVPGSEDLMSGCPGSPAWQATQQQATSRQLDGLLA